jgi:hypothetical protein
MTLPKPLSCIKDAKQLGLNDITKFVTVKRKAGTRPANEDGDDDAPKKKKARGRPRKDGAVAVVEATPKAASQTITKMAQQL